MEKSHNHSQNADDFAINSVYLETFRKRKLKNKQRIKNEMKIDTDLSGFSTDSNLVFSDSIDQVDSSGDEISKISKKQTNSSKLKSQFYSVLVSQLIPVVTKTVVDSLKTANKYSTNSDANSIDIENETKQNSDKKDTTFEIDLLKILRYLLRRWKSLFAIAILGGVIGFLISTFVLTPKYTAIADLYVTNKNTIGR